MYSYVKILILVATFVTGQACEPDKEFEDPEPKKSKKKTSTSKENDNEDVENENGDEYYGWGAKVGSAKVKKQVAECNGAGHFFDRVADDGKGRCDKALSVPFKCIDYQTTVKNTAMSATQTAKVDDVLKGELDGYLFDQCVEESERFVIYMVLQEKDGGLLVSTMSVPKNHE